MNKIKYSKVVLALFLSMILLGVTIPFVNATESYILGYSESNKDDFFSLMDTHPSDSAFASAVSQSFSLSANVKLKKVGFYSSQVEGTIGSFLICLYRTSGIYGTTSIPFGSPLATSEVGYIAQLENYPTFSMVNLSFNSENQYLMEYGVTYALAIQSYLYYPENVTQRMFVGCDASSPSHPGNPAEFYEWSWKYRSDDLCFKLYGEDEPIVTIINPETKAYTELPIPIKLNVYSYFIDTIWWNVKEDSEWLFDNATYTEEVNFTITHSGQFTFWAWINNTDGVIGSSTRKFTLCYEVVIMAWYWSQLPFFMGIIGLGMMLIGSIVTIKNLKEHDMEKALVFALVFIPIGFALLVMWLWG